MKPDPAPVREYEAFLKSWNTMASVLQASIVLLGMTATVSALVVATFADDLGTAGVRVVAFVSAVSIGVITAFDLPAKATGVREGWRHLNVALMRYHAGEYSLTEVIDAYSEGERMLGNVSYRRPGADK